MTTRTKMSIQGNGVPRAYKNSIHLRVPYDYSKPLFFYILPKGALAEPNQRSEGSGHGHKQSLIIPSPHSNHRATKTRNRIFQKKRKDRHYLNRETKGSRLMEIFFSKFQDPQMSYYFLVFRVTVGFVGEKGEKKGSPR